MPANQKSEHQNFYPRPPRGGRHGTSGPTLLFLDFYPRPPRGGRHVYEGYTESENSISIHALREEGDAEINRGCNGIHVISIHALREEGDRLYFLFGYGKHISIHALREEGDE